MAKVISKRISWTAATTPDIVAHRVYVEPEGTLIDYNSFNTTVDMPKTDIVVPGEFPGWPMEEGNYGVGISSVDDMGNESDITIISSPFDFSAPDAPTGVVVEDV